MTLDHDRSSEMLSGYARGTLEEEKTHEVEAHLGSCDACRAELSAIQALIEAEPPALTETQKASIYRHAVAKAADLPPRAGRTPLLAVAAALVLIAVGFVYIAQGGGVHGAGEAASSGGSAGASYNALFSPRDRIALDRSAGPITTASLRKLAASRSFATIRSRKHAAAGPAADSPYADRLKQVTACARQVTAAGGNSPTLVYAGFGRDDKGKDVSALGFVYSSKQGTPPDHYAFWVWRLGKCSSTPELYVSGMLKP